MSFDKDTLLVISYIVGGVVTVAAGVKVVWRWFTGQLSKKDDIIKQIAQDKKEELAVKDAELKEANEKIQECEQRIIAEVEKRAAAVEAVIREFTEE